MPVWTWQTWLQNLSQPFGTINLRNLAENEENLSQPRQVHWDLFTSWEVSISRVLRKPFKGWRVTISVKSRPSVLEWIELNYVEFKLMEYGPSALLGPLLENSIPSWIHTQLTNLLIPGVLRLDLTTVQCAHQMFCALMLGLLGKGTGIQNALKHSGVVLCQVL